MGKNEVIIFSHKIDKIGAAQGYIVARSFTKYAKQQASQWPRVKLLEFNDSYDEEWPDLHAIKYDINGVNATLYSWEDASKGQNLVPVVFDEKLSCLLEAEARKIVAAFLNKLPTQNFDNGIFNYSLQETIRLEEVSIEEKICNAAEFEFRHR